MTAVGVEAQISEALLTRLAALTLSPALQVAYPNITFPVAGQTKPATYLEAHQLRAATQGIGISTWDEHGGILQVDVVYSAQDGVKNPNQIADAVAAWFPRKLVLPNGAVTVRIDWTPAIAAPVDDPPYTRTPVSIRYRTFVK